MESSKAIPATVSAARHLHSRLRFRHLDLIAALGEYASLHGASRALAMTQPAASKLLREIESMLGVRLFERSRTGVVPTASGCALIERARLLLGLLDGTRDEIAAIESGATGWVRLGVAAVAAPVLLPRVVTLLAGSAPGVVLSIREGGPEMLDELRRGELDGVVGRIAKGDEGTDLVVERLYEEPVVIVARPNHPMTRRSRQADWPRALSFDWVLPPAGAPIRRALQIGFAQSKLTLPRSRVESLSVLANIAMVRDSDALALLPSRVAERYAELGLVSILPLPLPLSLPPVALIRRRGEQATIPVGAFVEALRSAVKRQHRSATASRRRSTQTSA